MSRFSHRPSATTFRKREEAVSSINGNMIRPVRTGRRVMFGVDGTGCRFETQEDAEAFADTLPPKRS